MKIGLRILLGYFLIVGLAAWFLLNVFVQQVKPGVRAAQEDTLVDTAYLLAEMVKDDVAAGKLDASVLLGRIEAVSRREIDVQIDGMHKTMLNYRVYITNTAGVVIFDSLGRDVGADYSRWNDVYLTLRGRYGARSTRAIYGDDASTVMHVAAPIRDQGKLIGVLTVAKPNSTVQPFVERSQRIILQRGALLLLLSLLIGLGFAYWLMRALGKLMRYVVAVEAGDKAPLPALGRHELGTLARALEAMRERLEGKEYVEQLMHTMAHELKSPIAAIQGSAELLCEEMPPQERQHFLQNILSQNARQKQLIDKLLDLIRVEKQQQLSAPETVATRPLCAQVAADFQHKASARRIALVVDAADCQFSGDAVLLRQALGNLVDNAIDFSPAGAAVHIGARRDGDAVLLTVRDGGSGIPDFAHARLFERFYSLPRANGARSTGLGLPFVREVAALHGGTAAVDNVDDDGNGGGSCGSFAIMRLPA